MKVKVKHFLHHLLFPRESNNHRSKLLHHDSLFFVIALFVFLGSVVGTVQHTHPDVLGISSNISAQDLLTYTNQKRQENGLKPLAMNGQLAQAAEQKASHMLANNYWAHVAPDGTTPWYFIKNSGYEYLYAGENLARGFTTASDVVNAWMNSPTHRENMLSSNYDDVGFAIQTGTLTGSDTILVVQELGRKYGGQSEVADVGAAQTTPTPVVVAVASPAPTKAVLPSATPAVTATPTLTPQPEQPIGVASVENQPLFDSKSLTKNIALGVLVLFLIVLVADAIIVERRNIARIVAHNVDHILFLLIIVLVVIIIGRGWIL
jgi:hypothetical protein